MLKVLPSYTYLSAREEEERVCYHSVMAMYFTLQLVKLNWLNL